MEIVGSVILSIVQSILFYGKEIGISMLLFEIICNGIVYYILNKKNRIENKNGILLMVPILLLSNTYFIFANTTFYIVNIFVILVLNLIMYEILVNEKDYLTNYLYKTFELITNTIMRYKEGVELTKRASRKIVTKNENINKENIKKVAISVLIVFVVVGIVLALLSSADIIFANLFSGIGNLLENINVGTTFNIILRIAIIIIIYLLFLSLFLSIQKKNRKEERKIKESSGKYNFTIKLLLIVLNIVYLVFCFIQIQSLFAKVNISNSFDYATYARKGFFQLMFVSFINFGLILISNRYYEKEEKIVKISNLLLVLFTIIIAISAMYRMYMYETEFGLTYLRTFVYVILITEIIAFIPTVVYIYNKKFDLMKWYFIVGIFAYCIANYMNIEGVIISKNINRNNIHPIDYEYISNIASEDSYQILEGRLSKEDITAEEKLDILEILLNIASNNKDLSWQEFNISKYKLQKRKVNIQELNKEIEENKKYYNSTSEGNIDTWKSDYETIYTSEQLKKYEKDFNTLEINGFIISTNTYTKPSEIDLEQVFYNGAGFNNEVSKEELEEYKKIRNYYETDIVKITTKQAEKVYYDNTGEKLENLKERLKNWTYIEKYDAYYKEISDINFEEVHCIKGIMDKQNNILKIQLNNNRIISIKMDYDQGTHYIISNTNNENLVSENKGIEAASNILYKKKIDENTIVRVKNLEAILAQRSVIDIEKSTDGGKTYISQTKEGITIHNGAEFMFINENIGFINDPGLAGTGGENKGFLVTTDGGKTFNDANIIHPDNIEEKNLLVKGVPYIEDGKLKVVIYTLNHRKSPERTYYEFTSNDNGITWEFYKNK